MLVVVVLRANALPGLDGDAHGASLFLLGGVVEEPRYSPSLLIQSFG